MAVLLQDQVSGWLAVPATLLVGLAIGTLMGSLTVFGKVPSFIITLAGLVSLRGATFLASDGAPIGGRYPANAASPPQIANTPMVTARTGTPDKRAASRLPPVASTYSPNTV